MVTTKALYSRGGSRMVTLKQHWDSFISSTLIRLLLVPLTKEKQSSVPYLLGSPSNYHWMLVSNFRYAISPPCSWSVSCCFLNIILYALCPVWYWIASRENFYLLSLYIVSYLVFLASFLILSLLATLLTFPMHHVSLVINFCWHLVPVVGSMCPFGTVAYNWVANIFLSN